MDRILIIEEKARAKLRKLCPITYQIKESVEKANDWVEHLKKYMKGYVESFSSFCNYFESLDEDISENYKKKIIKACWDISTLFAEFSLEYTALLKKQTKLLTTQARKKIDNELNEYWISLEHEFNQSKMRLKQLLGQGQMTKAFNDKDMEIYKKYIEQFLQISFSDVRKNLEGIDDALGNLDDIIED